MTWGGTTQSPRCRLEDSLKISQSSWKQFLGRIPLNSEAADGTCLQNIVAICYCYNAIIYNTIVVAWCICSNMNIINGCDTYYQKYHGMNTHGILKLLDLGIVSGGFFSFFPLFSPQQRLQSKGLQHHALTKGGRSQLMCLSIHQHQRLLWRRLIHHCITNNLRSLGAYEHLI